MGLPDLIERFKSFPLIFRVIIVGLVGLLVVFNVLALFMPSPDQNNKPATKGATATQVKATGTPVSSPTPGGGLIPEGTVSPLIFGTNLSLRDNKDLILASPSARALLRQVHVRIIRIPVSKGLEVQAAKYVKELGAIPLINLPGPNDPNALATAKNVIKQMNDIFGVSRVYYEFGNEDDLLGTSVESYTAAWNKIVPQIKFQAPLAVVIGPVTYTYDAKYLETFLKTAQPRPDAVSWHEYACTKADPGDTCLANLSQWGAHITDARKLMTKAIGRELPIMITEWNYAPDATATDGKSNDDAFMSLWTLQALKTLLDNKIFAAMQYSCTNSVAPLISDQGGLTTQGAVFQSMYELLATTTPSNSNQ